MRITLLAVGSRGDAQPYIALALGLAAAGHVVRFATHEEFRPMVQGRGLEFAPLSGNPREIIESEAGLSWLESSGNPVKFVRNFGAIARAAADGLVRDSMAACDGAEAIVYSALAMTGYHIADLRRVPRIWALLQPFYRTRAYPSFLFGVRPLGGPLNKLTYWLTEQLMWQPFRPLVGAWRRKMDLPPTPFLGPFGGRGGPLTTLFGYSESVVPTPADWPARDLTVSGYWFLDRDPAWQAPPDLLRFLESGPPPVYIGFGSMANRDAARTTASVLEALRLSGQRGLVMTGWSGMDAALVDHPDVFALQSAPHDWLFPRVSAVVHHGGAGTSAAGFRAGVPSIIVPFFADQPLWGARACALGVGPKPIPSAKLDGPGLAAAISRAVDDRDMRAKAASLGVRIRAEDGVARGVQAIERAIADFPART